MLVPGPQPSLEKGFAAAMFRSVILRFVLPVALASCVVAYFGLPYIQRLLAEWFRADVEQRAELAMHSMEEPIAELVAQAAASGERVERQFEVVATVPSLSNEPVARFKLTLSLKKRS